MSDKAVKLAVKAARDACSSKDYSTAVKACREALALDAGHYDCLTILGRSECGLTHFAESEAAYNRAVAAQPERTTAYQGLAELFRTTQDLVKQEDALKTLLKLFATDKDKVKEYSTQLAEVDKKLRPPKESEVVVKKVPAKQPSKKNSKGTGTVTRCTVPGCGERLNDKNTCKCKDCGILTCIEHQYPVDHDCAPLSKKIPVAARPPSASAGIQVIKKKQAPPSADSFPALPSALPSAPVPAEAKTEAKSPALLSPVESEGLKAQRSTVEATLDGLMASKEGDIDQVLTLLESRIAVTVKKQPPLEREAGLLGLELLIHRLGRRFEPHAPARALPIILQCLGDGRGGVGSAAVGAMMAFVSGCQAASIPLVMPALLKALDDRAFRVKEGVLQAITMLARRSPHQVGLEMPAIFPALSDCLKDTHPKVNEGAEKCLEELAKVITQPETLKIMVALKLAILKPAEHTHECLDQLMETTFINSVDAASLSWLVPVVARGLREPSADLVKKAATTAGNVCALISDARDIHPFVPLLLPGLTKAVEHSHPDVRTAATRARASLLKGAHIVDEQLIDQLSKSTSQLNLAAQSSQGAPCDKTVLDVSGRAGQLASGLVKEWEARGRLSKAEATYITDLVACIAQQARSASGLEVEISSAVWPLLEPAGVPQEDCQGMCQQVTEHVKEFLKSTCLIEDLDYIVRIEGIILAFAGKVLLSTTDLLIERKHRYGLVGQNGMGKTTLLNRIAAGDIKGFPQDITVYYIQHEILSEGSVSVFDFMLGQVPAGTTEGSIKEKLMDVGFTDDTMSKAVTELSGGWRMKLAIARSMLWNADFLLLDEPTNHLDKAAVKWLADKINSLTNTTVALVSHDYDFLELVTTDVIHIAEKKLTYYKCGFKEFQRQRPKIVAALPSPENAVRDANVAAEEAASASAETSEAVGASEMLKVASMASLGGSDGGAMEVEAGEGADSSKAPMSGLDKIVAGMDKPIVFPDPGRLEGIVGRRKTVMRMDRVSFKYDSAAAPVLTAATGALCLASRVALIGANGAGKTTMLKLLVGELEPTEGVGEVWKHHNLRVSYIAQHSMHHLEASLEQTPLMYIQNRFYMGRDKEVAKLTTLAMTDEDKAAMEGRGGITKVVGRQVRGGNKLWYEVTKNGRRTEETDWEPMVFLEKMPPYVMKLIKNYDEHVKALQSGMAIRPITSSEVRKHLADFGIDEDLASQKIKRMSGGQRSRLVLAAANWAKPHLIALDEPTNYLDNDTLAAQLTL
eukprot:CAMPEP_0196585252 /NCGR_PEP_ID=MMETSP1081-20130531/49991_1 /TAXON_ID=36882 /ORGANISM="Pyramimonas amylifera, Strain CCMP720" /LENGTH=1259 /DNA_ID=CAMNT_0041906735 /DNA_START=72 /DNA_END=3852 /DNA_ORIENTATION=-